MSGLIELNRNWYELVKIDFMRRIEQDKDLREEAIEKGLLINVKRLKQEMEKNRC